MFKKLLCAILASAMAVCAFASCSSDDDKTTVANTDNSTSAATGAQTDKAGDDTSAEIVIEETADVDVTALLDAIVASIENAPEGVVYTSKDNPIPATNFCSLFGGDIQFDDDFNPIYPEIMNKIDSYAMRIANGKNPISVDVFKLKNGQDREAVSAICRTHQAEIEQMMFGYDGEGIMASVKSNNGQVVYAKGTYVIMLSVLDPAGATAAIDAALKIS